MLSLPVCNEIFPEAVILLTTVSTYDLWFVFASCISIYQARLGATVILQREFCLQGLTGHMLLPRLLLTASSLSGAHAFLPSSSQVSFRTVHNMS